ncbi:MAG: cytochrome c oxidase subunit [Baekduia sp.]|nr:cytochrome c oxidase subunit [Baekduia sp.]
MRRGNFNRAEAVVVGVIASAVGIAAGLLIHWFPTAASTQAGPIDTLWDVLLVVSIPIFVIVACVVLFSVKWFRVQPGEENEDGPPIHGNTKLEVIWTAIPSALIASLVVYAYIVLVDIEKAPANPSQERHVRVTARQFAWSFEYDNPKAGGKPITSNFLYLPEDESVKFDIKALDVLHDFWVPAFRMKIDAVPGITTHYRVTPNRKGTYPVVCAELCGLGHAFMRSEAHVVSRADFDAWLAKLAAPPAPAGGGETAAVDAKKLFTDGNGTSIACGQCHTLADAGTSGQVGPVLDKVLADKDAAFIKESILNPSAEVAKGFQDGIMPKDYSKTLSPQELDALVNYLDKVTSK